MELVPATGALLDQILAETYGLWGEGLGRTGYARFDAAQRRTAWGSAHLRRLVLVDSGLLLSTAKRYDFQARLDGRLVRAVGIGALFTPPATRRRGFARTLVDEVLREAARDGIELAILFSSIGPELYERLGFFAVPVETVTLDVARARGAPAVPIRAGEDGDLTAVAEMHMARALPYRFALDRPPDYIQYAIKKKRLMAGLGPRGRRSLEFFVVEEGARAAAYAVVSTGPEGWMVEECGDRDPSGARVGAVLQAMLARLPAGPVPRIRGWLPAGFLPPQLAIVTRKRPPEVMMLRLLQPELRLEPPLAQADLLYWHGDIF